MEILSLSDRKMYQNWFNIADSDGDGRLTGKDAIEFFAMSNLSTAELKQVWVIADSKRQGFLGLEEFITAMQLLSLAQEGHELTSDLLKDTGKWRNCYPDFYTNYPDHLETLSPPSMEGLDTFVEHRVPISNDHSEINGSTQPQTTFVRSLFSKKSKNKSITSFAAITSVVDGLKMLYNEKLKPLEATYLFHEFVSPALTSSDFDAKPMVMLLGQYSTGKTTFIKHFLQCNYPGAHIGPEPTTDRFIVVMSGPDKRIIPGNSVAVHADMPFTGLANFGGSFLSKFECAQMPHPLLEHITLVDTPGVLSDEKQQTQGSYDFTGVISWFAAKCDLILLLFDPHKLGISDEFKRVISSLRGHDYKIRVVLNKAHQVDTQQLMRVYGALMWSLGKVLNSPSLERVYIGSFDQKPVNEADAGPLWKELCEKEQADLLQDLRDMPKNACDCRVNEFIKRATAVKVHAYIIGHLKKEIPTLWGKKRTQQKLIDELDDIFTKVQGEFHLSDADFPDVDRFKKVLAHYNIDKFAKLKPRLIQAVDEMIGCDIPELLKNLRNVNG